MKLDLDKFFAAYREQIGGGLSQVEVLNLTEILNSAQNDARVTSVRQLAYMIATARWETRRFERLREMGSKTISRSTPARAAIARALRIITISGAAAGATSRFVTTIARRRRGVGRQASLSDLERTPTDILRPDVNYEVMVTGHLTGGFTGFKLGAYVNSEATDYRNARLVINPGELYIANGKWKATAERKEQCIAAIDSIIKWAKGTEAALRTAEMTVDRPMSIVMPAVTVPAVAAFAAVLPEPTEAPAEVFEPKQPEGAAVTPQLLETAKEQAGNMVKTATGGLTFSTLVNWFTQNRWLTAVVFGAVVMVFGFVFRRTLAAVVKKGWNTMKAGQ